MEDEGADRVYAPPDRDVEPLWEPEELEAPVHGRPVPHDTPPPVPVPPAGVYRPGDRVPVPPPPAIPVSPPYAAAAPQHGQPPVPVQRTNGVPAPQPPQSPAPPSPPPPSAPVSGSGALDEEESGVHTSPDSPWSQPPQRPTPPTASPEPAPAPPAMGSASVPPPPAQRGAAAPAQGPQAPDPRAHATPPPHPPGPYPPSVDPRAFPQPPHPQMYQAHPQVPPPAHPQAPSQPPTDPFQDLPWVSDGTPTAEEFARRRLAKPPDPIAKVGVRGAVNNITGGLAKLSPGRREVERKQDVEMVRRNFGGLRQVTVVNPKGGAGKTVAVLLLAMTFGQKRGGYVLAWDNNETQGTLGMRAQQDFHARTVRDMMRDLHLFRGAHGRVGDLSQYVRAQGEGMFDVLASDESATAGEMLTADAFAEIREIVSRFYKLIFVDTGNNVRAQNWQAAMDATDQLVITMSARNDSAETAARMLDHLEQSGRQRLVRQAISVVSMPPTRKDIDLPAIQRHFAARTRAVLLAPYEKLIDSGEPLRYGQLSGNTRDAWLKIAAAVAEGL
ncbi:MinD/ParA family ATP-binding protein [Actinoplanes sp. CA-131856]